MHYWCTLYSNIMLTGRSHLFFNLTCCHRWFQTHGLIIIWYFVNYRAMAFTTRRKMRWSCWRTWIMWIYRDPATWQASDLVRNHLDTVDLIIFACLNFREFVILVLFTKSIIRELSILMIGSAHNNNFCEIIKFASLSSSRISRKLKPREYEQIYSIYGVRYCLQRGNRF